MSWTTFLLGLRHSHGRTAEEYSRSREGGETRSSGKRGLGAEGVPEGPGHEACQQERHASRQIEEAEGGAPQVVRSRIRDQLCEQPPA